MLPNADPAAVDALEELVANMEPITTTVEKALVKSAGKTEEGILQDMLDMIFQNIPEEYTPKILGYQDTKWECNCSKEQMATALMTIGEKELTSIIEEDQETELEYHFCNSKYHFTEEELLAIRDRAKGNL